MGNWTKRRRPLCTCRAATGKCLQLFAEQSNSLQGRVWEIWEFEFYLVDPLLHIGPTGGIISNPDGSTLFYLGISGAFKPGPSGSFTVAPHETALPGIGISVSGFRDPARSYGPGLTRSYSRNAEGQFVGANEYGLGTRGISFGAYIAIDPSQIPDYIARAFAFDYVTTPSTLRSYTGSRISSNYSFSPTPTQTGDSIGVGGGSISQLSQSVVGYASTPGANYTDPNFISALRAINEYNNALVTSK